MPLHRKATMFRKKTESDKTTSQTTVETPNPRQSSASSRDNRPQTHLPTQSHLPATTSPQSKQFTSSSHMQQAGPAHYNVLTNIVVQSPQYVYRSDLHGWVLKPLIRYHLSHYHYKIQALVNTHQYTWVDELHGWALNFKFREPVGTEHLNPKALNNSRSGPSGVELDDEEYIFHDSEWTG
ncbi:hypothetical protein P280DRAFT_515296 [Massarina eburnea CBS 473.64]|uniref:Uncharacterized protein n=1 Tax=Massarina eburnea CBS 473.64 TaxID=1395130 RepID=A0A6A6SC87_9PLEO|nr:hypothetical protein P280DRAFT_515296 [Massarina eburnea CBS 473.64]